MDSTTVVLLSSNTFSMVLMCAVVAAIVFFIAHSEVNGKSSAKDKKSKNSALVEYQRPPGPTPLPIIGNLACMGGYEVPFQAFDDLAKKYGPIISLRLGSVPTVVINGIDNIKEVLITKSSHFDSRPNFERYNVLFSGNKQNCKYFFGSFYFMISSSSNDRPRSHTNYIWSTFHYC